MAFPPRRSTIRSDKEPATLQDKISQLLAEASDERIGKTVTKRDHADRTD